jgi:hypothetical protein
MDMAMLAVAFLGGLAALSGEPSPVPAAFTDDSQAHGLYRQMLETIKGASALSWVSDYRWEAEGKALGQATYHIWLEKPNYARMEAGPIGAKEPKGTLVQDGESTWIYWSGDKPRYGFEMTGKRGQEYERYRRAFYMREPAPLGKTSIGHNAGRLGVGICMTILDPSTFHGYVDSLQPHLDGVQARGAERVKDEECDVIEVSFMKGQRTWRLWLARKDHLPRKLKEVVHVRCDIVTEETWSEVVLGAGVPQGKFAWSPPADWKRWRMPDLEEGLLEPGTLAPDFELAALDGRKVKLSGFRGKIVWLNKWRSG